MVHPYGVTMNDLERLTMPTLIIVGEHDSIREKQTKEMASHIPHCEVEVFRDGDHFVAAAAPSRLQPDGYRIFTWEIISMKFIKAGEIADSNIFNKLDERKKSLLEGGMDVINLSIGTPDFQPGKHVMEAISRAALDPDMYKYSLNETRELLDAAQDWYKRRYDVTLADDEIMAVCGSQEGIAHVGFAFAGPNDLILAPDPGYPIFSFGPMMTGATVGLYPLYAEKNWQLDFNDIPEDVAERAKAIVVSYPNNPTTAVADRRFYEKLVLWAREHNIIVLHDNAYSDIMLNGEEGLSFLSIPGAKEVGIEFNLLVQDLSRPACACPSHSATARLSAVSARSARRSTTACSTRSWRVRLPRSTVRRMW